MVGKYFIDELDLESFYLTVEKLGKLVFDIILFFMLMIVISHVTALGVAQLDENNAMKQRGFKMSTVLDTTFYTLW